MQFRKGNLVQAYGRANSPVKKEIFSEAMDILSLRISKFPFLIWKKEKYEIIGNWLSIFYRVFIFFFVNFFENRDFIFRFDY